jgi:hypothetical protein
MFVVDEDSLNLRLRIVDFISDKHIPTCLVEEPVLRMPYTEPTINQASRRFNEHFSLFL